MLLLSYNYESYICSKFRIFQLRNGAFAPHSYKFVLIYYTNTRLMTYNDLPNSMNTSINLHLFAQNLKYSFVRCKRYNRIGGDSTWKNRVEKREKKFTKAFVFEKTEFKYLASILEFSFNSRDRRLFYVRK